MEEDATLEVAVASEASVEEVSAALEAAEAAVGPAEAVASVAADLLAAGKFQTEINHGLDS